MSKKSTTTIECYQLKNGEKRYLFKICIGIDPLTDKEKRTTRSNFKTQKEAKLELALIKLESKTAHFSSKLLKLSLTFITYG